MLTNAIITAKEGAKDRKNSAIAKAHIPAYRMSNNVRLYDVYENYSRAKEYAFERCKSLMYDLDGWGLTIISYNSNVFTVGFEFCDDETGALMFAYITRDYDRYCYQ